MREKAPTNAVQKQCYSLWQGNISASNSGKVNMKLSFGGPKRKRGPGKSGTDRLAKEEARFIRDLRTNDPATYRKYMERRIGIGSDDTGLKGFAQTASVLKETFGIDVAKALGGEGDGTLRGILKEFTGTPEGMAVFGAIIARIMGAMPTPPQQQQPQVTVTQPTQQPTINQPQNSQLGEPQVTAEAQALIAELQQRTPEEAVAWMRGQNRTDLSLLVTMLAACKTRDDIVNVFKIVLQVKPEYRPVLEWLANDPQYIDGMIAAAQSNTMPATQPEVRKKGAHGL